MASSDWNFGCVVVYEYVVSSQLAELFSSTLTSGQYLPMSKSGMKQTYLTLRSKTFLNFYIFYIPIYEASLSHTTLGS